MNKHVDVVVVGAGPVGLVLAIELTLGGAGVMVLERLTAPDTAIKGTAIGPIGVEALQRRGMGPALAEAEDRGFAARGPRGAEMRAQAHRSRGHFASLPLRYEAVPEPGRRMLWVNQEALEAILAARAAALGIDVRRGCEVFGTAPDEEGVTVRWTSPAGAEQARCGWLAGCDGGRSTVRKMTGFAFPGTPPSLTMYQAVLDLDHPERLARGATRSAEGVVMNGPRPRWLAMHDFSGPPADRKAPVTRDEIEAALRRISGADVRITAIEQANRFTDTARVVDTYRQGRVLLAGDAAHVHSPLGGQGLALGRCDAANLGWKLAAVIGGNKPGSLLGSYTAERRPVAEAVLANTLAQLALARPDPQSTALRQIFAKLMELDDVNAALDGVVSGLATRYDFGSESALVGRLAGDRPVGRGDARTSLFAVMAAGDGVLVDASPDGRLAGAAAGFTRLRHVSAAAGPSMLVRPDGCIAWADDADEAAAPGEAIERWFSRAAG